MRFLGVERCWKNHHQSAWSLHGVCMEHHQLIRLFCCKEKRLILAWDMRLGGDASRIKSSFGKHSEKSKIFDISEMTWRQNPFVVGPCYNFQSMEALPSWTWETWVGHPCCSSEFRTANLPSDNPISDGKQLFSTFHLPFLLKNIFHKNICLLLKALLFWNKNYTNFPLSATKPFVQGTTRDWDLSLPSRAERFGCLQVPPAMRWNWRISRLTCCQFFLVQSWSTEFRNPSNIPIMSNQIHQFQRTNHWSYPLKMVSGGHACTTWARLPGRDGFASSLFSKSGLPKVIGIPNCKPIINISHSYCVHLSNLSNGPVTGLLGNSHRSTLRSWLENVWFSGRWTNTP